MTSPRRSPRNFGKEKSRGEANSSAQVKFNSAVLPGNICAFCFF
jgi:hypothetical protein